jgi:predicted nucleotidyltransferase
MLLKSKYKQILFEIFSGITAPIEVCAYGSRVTGTAHEGSDLDLVVRAPNNEKFPMDMLMGLKEKIRESNIPILVEIFDWARLPESFHKNIEASHEVLYSSSELNILHEPETEYNKKKPEENG